MTRNIEELFPPLKKKTPAEETKPITIRMDPLLLADIEKISSQSGYKRAQVVVRLLRSGADELLKKPKK